MPPPAVGDSAGIDIISTGRICGGQYCVFFLAKSPSIILYINQGCFLQKNSGCYPLQTLLPDHTSVRNSVVWSAWMFALYLEHISCTRQVSWLTDQCSLHLLTSLWVMQWLSKLAPCIQWPVRSGFSPDSLFRVPEKNSAPDTAIFNYTSLEYQIVILLSILVSVYLSNDYTGFGLNLSIKKLNYRIQLCPIKPKWAIFCIFSWISIPTSSDFHSPCQTTNISI